MRYEQRCHVQPDMPQNHRRCSILTSCPILSALVALAIAYSPLVAKPSTQTTGSAQSSVARTFNVVDRARKGDRLVPAAATFAARWNIQNDASGWRQPSTRSS